MNIFKMIYNFFIKLCTNDYIEDIYEYEFNTDLYVDYL